MSNLPPDIAPLTKLDSSTAAELQSRATYALQNIVKSNIFTKFGRTSDVVAGLREALTDVDLDDRAACAKAFHVANIPMTEYTHYAPYISKFFETSPCQRTDVADLLAPGLPQFFGMSSSTSGKASKPILKYGGLSNPLAIFSGRPDGLSCRPAYCGYKKFVEVQGLEEGAPNVRIPCTAVSSPWYRTRTGFSDFERDHERLSESIPGLTAPFGVGLVANYRSFLLMHAVFALAEASLDTLSMSWSTTFMDFIRWIDEEWEILIDAILTGKLPQLPETEHVYSEVASTLIANPARAEYLRQVGPPSQTPEAWAVKVWPKLELLIAVCSGTFGRVSAQARACIGPKIPIRCPLYACTECTIAIAYDDRLPNVLQVIVDDYIEMLEITPSNEDGVLKPLWAVDVGKVYEPVVTTRDGLWRYRTLDAVHVVGFSPADGTLLIEYKERRNQSMWIAQALISQTEILESVSGLEEFDHVEFTTWWDDRSQPAVIGMFLEDTPKSRRMSPSIRDKILEGLSKVNENFASGAKRGLPTRPTIRLLAPGTFGEFRSWKGSVIGVGSTQVKLPIIMLDTKAQEFVLSRVVSEIQ